MAAFGLRLARCDVEANALLTEDTDRYVMTETSVSKSDYTMGDLFDEHGTQRLVDSATGVTGAGTVYNRYISTKSQLCALLRRIVARKCRCFW